MYFESGSLFSTVDFCTFGTADPFAVTGVIRASASDSSGRIVRGQLSKSGLSFCDVGEASNCFTFDSMDPPSRIYGRWTSTPGFLVVPIFAYTSRPYK